MSQEKFQTNKTTWIVYLARCSDNTFYCGITTDLDRRIGEHNGLICGGAKYTRNRRPVELIASLPAKDRSEALRIEIQIKRLNRRCKIDFFKQHNNEAA